MNLRNVLRAYSLLRQLSDDETALLNTLRKMTDTERGMFVDGLSDKSQKKSNKKSAGGGGRRPTRGESLKQQISNRTSSPVQASATTATESDGDGSSSSPRCQAQRSDGRICMLLADHNIHHLTTVMDYHEFVQPAEQAAVTSGD